MLKKGIIIFGRGHLAYKVKKLLMARGHELRHYSDLEATLSAHHATTIDVLRELLGDDDTAARGMVYLLDESDHFNLEILISLIAVEPDISICASLFNEALRPHLQAAHPRLHILNPARIAAPQFVAALDDAIPAGSSNHLPGVPDKGPKHSNFSLIRVLTAAFVLLMILTTAYFHFVEGLIWLNALYFVVVTVTTVGYGDISLLQLRSLTKVVGIVLMLGSTIFIWMIFSLYIDGMIKRRVQLALGRKKYRHTGHIVLCGLGRLGYFIADELLARGEKLIVVEVLESAPHLDYLRAMGASVYIGNARLPSVLQDVNIAGALAIISVIDDDIGNLEIGLSARSYNPAIRPVLRVFDDTIATMLKDRLQIHTLLSESGIAAEAFVQTLDIIVETAGIR